MNRTDNCLSLSSKLTSCVAVTDQRHLDVPGVDRTGGRSLPSVVVVTGG